LLLGIYIERLCYIPSAAIKKHLIRTKFKHERSTGPKYYRYLLRNLIIMDKIMTNKTENKLRAFQGDIQQQPWVEVVPGLNVKALVVDEERNAVEFLMQGSKDWKPGPHRHVCETSLMVLGGSISNEVTGRDYGIGDFFYQEAGNTHVEYMGEQGLYAYVSMRANSDVLVEFLHEGQIAATMNVSHFSRLLP